MVLDDIVLEPSRWRSQSQGLSVRHSMAMAHSSAARTHMYRNHAVGASVCQMGVRISSTSSPVTSPMRGQA